MPVPAIYDVNRVKMHPHSVPIQPGNAPALNPHYPPIMPQCLPIAVHLVMVREKVRPEYPEAVPDFSPPVVTREGVLLGRCRTWSA